MIEQTLRETYKNVDDKLLDRCSRNRQHYATCTSVTPLATPELLVAAHLGDSRIVLGRLRESDGKLVGEQLTQDHKPNLENERRRIEECGGMVEHLQNHQNKPFIRGGDFMMRKALGEQPMQLQYSRAFGAKDLKIFGLSNSPDVKFVRLNSAAYQQTQYAILASDGLWDVFDAQQAVEIVYSVVREKNGGCPAKALVEAALGTLRDPSKKAPSKADNITVIVVQFVTD